MGCVYCMEERLTSWLNNLYLILIFLPVIPVIFDANNRYWQAYIAIGLLILVQCYRSISDIDLDKPDARQILLHRICDLGKLALLSWYIFLTGYWIFCPLYYIIISSGNIKDKKLAFLLPILGLFGVWFHRLINLEGFAKFVFAFIIVSGISYFFYLIEKILERILIREHLLKEQMRITALNELKVKNLNKELAIKYQLADLNARLEERQNIARNIHNLVGHTITSAIVSMRAYRVLRETEPELAEGKLSSAMERMRQALEEIRRAVRVLDQETDEISLKDFQQLLIAEILRFSMDTDLEVQHNLNQIKLERQISKRYCEFLHSALTECLNNGIRHGKASSFVVLMHCDSNCIELSISDNGSGFENASKEEQMAKIRQGYGLRKMEQFILEHGGSMRIHSEEGFSIHMKLPLLYANP